MTTARLQKVPTPARVPRGRARALAVAAASLAALVVWVVAVPIGGVDLLVRPSGGAATAVGAGAVVSVSLLAGLLGWALLAMLERRIARARTIWTGSALVVLLLSLAGPLTAGTTPLVKAVLALMHLTIAAVLIPALRRTSATR